MTIQDLKKKLVLSNKKIAEFFNLSELTFNHSSAKKRYENALIRFYEYLQNRPIKKDIVKLFAIPDVVGRSEQLPLSKCCNKDMKSMRYCTNCQEWEGGN